MTVIDRIRRTPKLGGVYFQPSITDGLVGLFQPRRSAAELIVNRGSGPDAEIVGSPAFTAWGAVLGPAAYIETAIPETAAYTIIAVVRKNPVGGVSIVSTLAGSVASTPFAQVVMRLDAPTRFAFRAKTSPDTLEKNIGYDFIAGNTDFEMVFSACDGSSLMHMLPRNPAGMVGGNPRTDALGGARAAPTANWRIGAARVSTVYYPNSTEHALTMIFNRALTELEGRAVYAEAAAYFAARGIAI